MKPDFDYNSVPQNFVHCFNNSCKHATECLRHQIALLTPTDRSIITSINPSYKIPDNKECPYFKADILKRFALGMSHLFDKISYNDAVIIKQQIQKNFEHSTYYRCKHKERFITPSEQACIRQLFLNQGIKEEPTFDEYVEMYEW